MSSRRADAGGSEVVATIVQEMDRTVPCYRDVRGFEILGPSMLDDPTFKLVDLQAGATRIDLLAFGVDVV